MEYTINKILWRIYNDNELDTNIREREMKDILILCTKKVHFTVKNKIYQQCDRVAVELPLGPVITEILKVQLEKS